MPPHPDLGTLAQSTAEQKNFGGERLLVCLSPSPFSLPLIRATSRIAAARQAKWYALYVETPAHDRLSPESRRSTLPPLSKPSSNPGIRRPRWGGVVEGVAGQIRHPLAYVGGALAHGVRLRR